jgi:hypothetical protein
VDEVMALQALYRDRYDGWNVRHFHCWYEREYAGTRSYTWVKNQLQRAGFVPKGKVHGSHHKKRLPAAIAGMMLHQDGSTHQWVLGQYWTTPQVGGKVDKSNLTQYWCGHEAIGGRNDSSVLPGS